MKTPIDPVLFSAMPDGSLPERIGPYTITREIGRGGMGVVYLGHDANLDRPVAIKAITEDLADEPERLARFEREAKVLASLSHGNIATVYGFESSGDRRFLIMEFVEGETLADRIASGALTVSESLSVCAQIAAGVEAAHEAGIVHRDLKPANVIVRPDGTPKVLDFGLARDLSSQSGSTVMADAATIKAEKTVTKEGVTLGSPGYMSPEQVRGMMVDRRTDNFAFGCILYECLVGTLAFPGITATDSIAAILQGEPDWKMLPEGTPPTVQLLLRRCLHKDRRRRLRDIGDARIELEQALDDPTSTAFGLAGAALAAAGRRHRTWRDSLPWLVAALALLAIPATWWMSKPEEAPAPSPVRLVLPIPADQILANWPQITLSNDGRQVAFRCRIDVTTEVFIRDLDQPEPRHLTGSTNGHMLFFSPDGEWIAFAQDGKLKKVSVRGGPSTTLCRAPNCRGGTWGPDGSIIVALDRIGGLARLPSAGGTPETITNVNKAGNSHRHPNFLPDGRGVLYTAAKDGGSWEDANVYLLPFDTNEPRLLFTEAAHAQYMTTGHIVFEREGTLMAAPFQLDTLEVTGPGVPVLENITTSGPASPPYFSISGNGTLIFMTGEDDDARQLTLLDHNGIEQQVGTQVGAFDNPRVSPNGEFIAITVEDEGRDDIKVLEIERDILRPLTFHPADDDEPVWSPDGQWIAFASKRDGDVANIYRVRADFTGEPERLTNSPDPQWPNTWSPDGRTIAFMQRDPETDGDLWLLHLDEDGAVAGDPEVFVKRPGWQWTPRYSPDGQWILYGSAESGQRELYVRPASGPGAAEQISTGGGAFGQWSPLEDRILYAADFSRPTTVHSTRWTVEGSKFRAAAPQEMFKISGAGEFLRGFNMTPDGLHLLISSRVDSRVERREPTIILNWDQELMAKTGDVKR